MRNRRKLRRYIITYDIVMTVLALISIGLVIFDLVGLISIGRRPFRVIDQSSLPLIMRFVSPWHLVSEFLLKRISWTC